MLDRIFRLTESGTTPRTELLAGTTTFLTMAYIVFVQPAVLSGALTESDTGLDFGAVLVATCLSAALASGLMGLLARYPVAQAPGMGQNFFFVLSVIPAVAVTGHPDPWRGALGVVFVAGVAFLILSLLRVREVILRSISPSQRHAIAVGIGLFIAFIGLRNAGVVLTDPGTAVRLNPRLASPDLMIFFAGLLGTAALLARRIRGALLLGILFALGLALGLRWILPHVAGDAGLVTESGLLTRFQPATGLVSAPPSLAPTFLRLDLEAALSAALLPIVMVVLFIDMFDTLGTLVGVSQQAGLMQDGQLPRARRAFVSDAVGSVVGAALGTSTVTSYVESAAGVGVGGRTGLTAVVTALWFLVALFFGPIIAMVGSYAPITAPALVVVGSMMMRGVSQIDWRDPTEALPAFLIVLGIPLTFSIADGIALGLIAYPLLKLLAGRARETSWVMGILASSLVAYFVGLRSAIG